MAEQDIKLTGFELLELLGQGGMGIVWKARQLSLDRLVAIKLLPSRIGNDPESIKQIMTEARMAAKLKHSGIVQVYDASEEHGHYFFVMEFVNGYNVSQWLGRSKVLPWKDVLVVAEAVAMALDYAWRKAGMIHCDVKPENIMVDQDGTIKVADLGLSRTQSREDKAQDEIMGTPAYMSPEQVRGDEPLDCRTDIFSLGSSMYQMLTGRRLFQEKPDSEVMDLMLTEQVADPRDLVQGIPSNVCALLERLLAKDRADRPKDWQAVIHDIHRVEKGLMPTTPAPASSTVNSRKTTVRKAPKAAPSTSEPRDNRSPVMLWLLIVLGALAVLFCLFYFGSSDSKAFGFKFGFGSLDRPVSSSASRTGAQEAFDAARRWEDDHPRQYETARLRFQGVVNSFPGTPQAAAALREIKTLTERAETDRLQVWVGLTNRVQGLVNQGRYENAINMLESYTGAWAAETSPDRAEWAQRIRQGVADREMAKVEQGRWQKLLTDGSGLIMAGKLTVAQQAVSNAVAGGQFRIHKNDLEAVNAILRDAVSLNDPILKSLQADIGKTVGLKLAKGDRVVKIVALAGRKIIAETSDGKEQVFIALDELSPAEQLARLGSSDKPGEALVKGLVAAKIRAFPQAETLLACTGPVLSGPLLKRLEDLKAIPADDKAESALADILTRAGITVDEYDEAQWSMAIRNARLTRDQAVALGEQREKFLEAFGASGFVVRSAPVLLLLEQVCQQIVEAKPVADVNGATVAAERPEPKGPMTVEEALRAKNPSLQGDQVRAVEGLEGRGLLILSEESVDLSPLAGYPGIKSLRIESAGSQKIPLDVKPLSGTDVVELRLKGHVIKDLAALHGIRLKRLAIPGTMAAGFASLEGLPLVELDVSGSSIKDLNPLRGMRLERLNVDDTKIASLMTLAGMPLRELSARGAPIRDIGVLKGLPLESLNLAQTVAFDYQPLRGLSLRRLNLGGTQIRDVSFCAGMPLKELILDGAMVTDIGALKGMSMDLLVLARTPLKDLSPLAGSTIGTLDLTGNHTPQRDLAPVLVQVTTTNLNLAETEVSTLSFLAGKKLTELNLRNTRVCDLSPLKGMPLQALNVQDTNVSDFDSLKTVPLKEIWITGERWKAVKLVEEFPELRMVNGRPIERRRVELP
jgi:serine/threonine protein kinase